MTKANHTLSGILLAEGIIAFISPSLLTITGISYALQDKTMCATVPPIIVGSMFGAVFPDIDLRIPGLEHRTLTHWFIPYIIGIVLAYFLGHPWVLFFCIGALVHILLDSLSLMGVPIWTPFGKRKGFKIMRVGNFSEVIAALLMVVCMYGVWMVAS